MIEVSHVSKSFGRVTALDDVSLRIDRGERVAFVGTNGSGKTTLLRAILGLLRVEGRVSIDGVDVAASPELALRSVAYIAQIAPPIEAPVGEVVRAHASLRRIAPDATAARARKLGLDLGAVRGVRFRDLSGGMKQKLLAAMALATEVSVLVCDEPTANLDATARAAFFAEVDERPKDSIVVLCSHRIEEVRQLVDRVVELQDGRIARDAPLHELLAEMKRFRVEVALERGKREAEAFLRANGFETVAPGRLGALFTQADKVDLVAKLLREHKDAIVDLSVYQVEDLHVAQPVRLRAVPS
ncbi:MAG TPA: ABC transporter ATP-binding protein [Polyangiaceae bacterium]|nr:ABC transporter ATP-binding protein [Polyangiaceae bacterium]